MSYSKFLVDNTTCSRRFHLSFDDEAMPQQKVEARCPFCDVVVFEAEEHPPVKIARQENLIKTQELSRQQFTECQFKDEFSRK